MSLEVIGAGFGRTGTLSIRIALEQIGFGPCYHMDNVFTSSEALNGWRAVANGREPDWGQLFGLYRSTVDWPGTLYWRELADAYPSARVLLSTRDAESWWASFSQTICKLIQMRDSFDDVRRRSVLDFAHEIIELQTFDGRMDKKEAGIAAFEKRIKDVKAAIDPDRLLVFDVHDGWAPLCSFFGVDTPEGDFPRCNDAGEFWKHFGGA